MTVNKTQNENCLLMEVIGRLDTRTAPVLEKEIKQSLDGVTELTIDLKNLEYISSGGIRVLLATQKMMNKRGKMTIKNTPDDIMEIFELTGFLEIFDFSCD